MKTVLPRRGFIRSLAIISAVSASTNFISARNKKNRSGKVSSSCHNLKTSLNAFSFNDPLSKGTMDLDDLLNFCAEQCFDAVDLTAYYFPGYPEVPSDEYLYHIKQKSFRLGLDISGTGVRNDFTDPNKKNRQEAVLLVKNWIEVASKLGAPVIRVFAGHQEPEGFTRDQITDWMVEDIHTCLEYGKKHGVVVAIQNHHDFIKNAMQVKTLFEKVQSDWFGLILDTGSYREGNPYEEIANSIDYAVNWQIKEKVFINDQEVDTDFNRLIQIIRASNYRGYLPIETLGPGDPKVKVIALFDKLKNALKN